MLICADDAYNSVIWSVADSATTIVATSMPVLRVFFQRAVNSAIETYQNSSGRGKSRNDPTATASTRAEVSLCQSSKRETDAIDVYSQESLEDHVGRDSKGYFGLEDLIVDEDTGRVSAATPESTMDAVEHRVPEWPL
jgi:hypothetical protein